MKITKEQLQHLYTGGKSMSEIANQLSCSIHTIVYWMNKYKVLRRNRSDATYIKENPHGDPFQIHKPIISREQFLYGVAMGVFWGEGTKATKHAVRLTNTDPAMIRIFREFLIVICGVHPEKIRYSLVTFQDCNPAEASCYWAKQLGISQNKFGTIVSIPPQGKGTYRKKSLYGVCSITVSNIKLKTWISQELENIKRPISSTAERSLGKTQKRVQFSHRAQR